MIDGVGAKRHGACLRQDYFHAGPRGSSMSPQFCCEEKLITVEKKPKDAVHGNVQSFVSVLLI